MQKKQILLNAVMSIIQIVIIGITLFILYRFLLKKIGVEQLGIWSLVLSVASVTQIANFGLSGSVVKFTAKYIARGELNKVIIVIQTAAISIGVFVGVLLLICYPIVHWLLEMVIPQASLHLAQSLLPFAFFALWAMIITSIFQAGLDGFQRIDIRTSLLMGGAVINLVLCFLLVPIYGLQGVAYSLVIQNILILFGSWIMLKKLLPEIPIFPHKWSKPMFKEIVGYGINFQVISATTILYDPITKAMLTKFGGLALTGYFEMASKMVQQFRAIIVSANQVLVPAIANLKEKSPEKIMSVYSTSYRLMFYLSLPMYSLIVISTPFVSELWIGSYEMFFVNFSILLSIGWFFNTLTAPAYFAYMGSGYLRWNVIAHIAIAFLNVCLGFIFGYYFGGLAVVIGWVFSLAIGSSLIIFSYHQINGIKISEVIPKESRFFSFAGVSCLIFFLIIGERADSLLSFLIYSIMLLLILTLMWFHPMRKTLLQWIKDGLIRKIG